MAMSTAPTRAVVQCAAKKGVKSGSTPTRGWGLPGARDDIDVSNWYGASRKLYLPGGLIDTSDIPSYLTGELAGDYGLDPFGISKNKADVEKYRVYEIIHGRWAMLGVTGMVIPEALEAAGAPIKGGTWYETGAYMLNEGNGLLNYDIAPWGIVGNPLPLAVVTAIEVALLFFVENYRKSGSGPEGYVPGLGSFTTGDLEAASSDPCYPGGPFDPFGLADDPIKFEELKVKEIKNARLAMLAFNHCIVSAAVTGEGPYANWSKHVADPFGYNIITVVGNASERQAYL